MHRCFALARRGGADTLSNPMVGAVLVHKDRVIGEGYHQKFGGPHAEVNCLASVKEADKHLVKEATIYVSLEPCCIHSKTPACTDAILNAGIKKVVVSVTDPNDKMNGQSIERLRKQGISVKTGVAEASGQRVIASFRAHLQKRPFVILKYAQSADGYLGKRGQQVWLSNQYSKLLVHKWRSEVSAILVGHNTITSDDPELNTRLVPGPDPLRLVLTRDINDLATYKVAADTRPTLFISPSEGNDLSAHKEMLKSGYGPDNIKELLHKLFQRGIYSILVEGGSKTHKSFITSGLWDEARVISTEKTLVSGIRAPKVSGQIFKSEMLEGDRIDYYQPQK